jgi:hypothetical protein
MKHTISRTGPSLGLILLTSLSLSCDSDANVLTRDGSAADGAEGDATRCPAEAPSSGACTGELTCEYGEESCCGETFPALVCFCSDGTWSCGSTDACLRPGCPDGGAPDAGEPDAGACLREGQPCRSEEACCTTLGLGCVLGECTVVDGCKRAQTGCESNSECCGLLRCEESASGGRTCCGRVSDVCHEDADCCGDMTCDEETSRCLAREQGESCVSSAAECAGSFVCCSGFCRDLSHPDC